jgi:hypothetical protein
MSNANPKSQSQKRLVSLRQMPAVLQGASSDTPSPLSSQEDKGLEAQFENRHLPSLPSATSCSILHVLPPGPILKESGLAGLLSEKHRVDTALENGSRLWMVDFDHIKFTGYFNQGDEGVLYRCSIPGKSEAHVVKLVCIL